SFASSVVVVAAAAADVVGGSSVSDESFDPPLPSLAAVSSDLTSAAVEASSVVASLEVGCPTSDMATSSTWSEDDAAPEQPSVKRSVAVVIEWRIGGKLARAALRRTQWRSASKHLRILAVYAAQSPRISSRPSVCWRPLSGAF